MLLCLPNAARSPQLRRMCRFCKGSLLHPVQLGTGMHRSVLQASQEHSCHLRLLLQGTPRLCSTRPTAQI